MFLIKNTGKLMSFFLSFFLLQILMGFFSLHEILIFCISNLAKLKKSSCDVFKLKGLGLSGFKFFGHRKKGAFMIEFV